MDNNITIDGLNADEWEALANPAPASNQQLEQLGIIDNTQQTQETINNNTEKEYESLDYVDTLKDTTMAGVTELSKFFIPKSKELQYTPRTKAGEAAKTFTRYLWGTSGLLLGGEATSGIKGLGWLSKALGGNKFFKTTSTNLYKKLGVNTLNLTTQGAVAGALLDNLKDPYEGRLADAFTDTDNKLVNWLKTNENDSIATDKFKNIVEGAIINMGFNVGFEALKPVVSNLLKNTKILQTTKSTKVAEEALDNIVTNNTRLEKIASTNDLLDEVKAIKNEADEVGEDASQMILDRLNPSDYDNAQAMLKTLNEGEDIFVHSDGTWDISISSWEDAYKVTPEEYKKQLSARDEAELSFNPNVRQGDNAIKQQDSAIKHTWTNRGWIGENEELNKTNAARIIKNYKDKWQIDNNINVEFVDGLTINGKTLDGNTRATTYLGKTSTKNKNKAKIAAQEQKQEIDNLKEFEQKLEYIHRKNWNYFKKSVSSPEEKAFKAHQDNLNKIIQEIKVHPEKLVQNVQEYEKRLNKTIKDLPDEAQTEAFEKFWNMVNIADKASQNIQIAKAPAEKISNITIQIDKNARNPYATLRAELEHARDIAKGEVPKDEIQHFARYTGANEGEVAPDYTYKKSLGYSKVQQNQLEHTQIQQRNQDNINKGYNFVETEGITNSGEGSRIDLINPEGNPIAYLDYHIDNGNLVIDQIFNTSHNTENYTKNTAEKLVDNLISQYPNLKIKWDAISQTGISFKNKYLKENPTIAQRINGINDSTLAQQDEIRYNTNGGVTDEGSSVSNGQELAKRGQENSRADTGKIQLDSKESRISNNNRTLADGDLSTNERGETSTISSTRDRNGINQSTASQVQIERISRVKSTEEITNNITNGELKLNSVDDVNFLLKKTEEINPEISGFKWKNIAKDSDKYSQVLSDLENVDFNSGNVLEILTSKDVNKMDEITRKVLASQKLKSQLLDKMTEVGSNADINVKQNIIDALYLIDKYTRETGSASGRSLQARKLINIGKDTFGSSRLSELTKEGISNLSDLISKGITEVLNLNFTRGNKLSTNELQQELYNIIFKENTEFSNIILENPDFKNQIDNVINNLIKNKNNNIDDINTELQKIITNSLYDEVYNASLLASKPEGKIATIRNWVNQQGGITSYYVHNLLSGVGTLAKNVVSGAMNSVYFPAKKIVAGMFLGGGESLAKEGWLTYKNMLTNWNESWQLCKQAFLEGEGKLSNVKDTMNLSEDEIFRGFKNIDWEDTSAEGIWTSLQNIHSLMTRAMGASDEFMSQLNYRSIVRAKALTQAEQAAELAGKLNDEKWINDYADTLFNNSFTAEGKPKDIQALSEAKNILYQLPLDGKIFNPSTGEYLQVRDKTWVIAIGSSINSLAATNPVMKIVFPFVKTGANILQMSLEHNPIYASLSSTQRNLLLSKTPEGSLARSQVAMGMFSFLLSTGLAVNGVITGSAPVDAKERKALFETGWKPYSVRIGDKYISYQGYEPLHTVLGFAADSINIGNSIMTSEDENKWQQMSQQIMALIINNCLDKAAFRTGLRQMAVLTDPETNAESFTKQLSQTMQGFLPDAAFIRNTSSLGQRSITQPKGLYERLFNSYFNRGLGDYRRDVFGNRQDNYGYLITNAGKDNSSEPAYKELMRLAEFGFNPTEISKTISDTTLKFQNFKDSKGHSAYDAMQEELSTLTINGRTLQQAVNELVQSEEYQLLPDGINMNGMKYNSNDSTKINAIRDLFIEYNDLAKQKIIENDTEYIDKKGRTMSEASDEVQRNKLIELNELY